MEKFWKKRIGSFHEFGRIKMKKLFTLDCHGGMITENAVIEDTYDLEKEAVEINGTLSGYRIESWVLAKGCHDAWRRLLSEPLMDKKGYAYVEGLKCKAIGPGEHSGLSFWWVQPVVQVFIPVYAPYSFH